ncbi:MAG: hypothetical protein ABWW66_06660 [Archaeoglobaceae archaeon]
MRITIEIPPEMEELLLKKCKEKNLTPEEFVYSLLDWYFFRRQRVSESNFVRVAKEVAEERVKTCKFSDSGYCTLDALDLLSDAQPRPIDPYRCLFCVYYVDRRRERSKPKVDARVYDIAKLAAKLVVELYGDKLFYKPKKDERAKLERLLDW